jgi:hypothetical protein
MYVRFCYWARRPRSSKERLKIALLIEQTVQFFAITIEIIAYQNKVSNSFLDADFAEFFKIADDQ